MSGTARIVLLPLGELEDGGHPYGECCRCGASARAEPCHLATLAVTRAAAVECDDVSACERRRYREGAVAVNPDDRFDDGLSWDEWFRSLPLNLFGADEGPA